MKIEIDTSSATKEELAHLSDMLRSLSGKSGAVASSAPVGSQMPGFMNIFGDDAPSDPYSSAQPAQSASSPAPDSSGGLFSIFSDSPASAAQQPAQQSVSEEDFVVPKKSSGKDILDDDRIQLY
jgi:hypothetical protein